MRKGRKIRKLSRPRSQRKALLKGLARSLILGEKIRTTEAKAKELRPFVEKIITKARKNNLAAFRDLRALFEQRVVSKLTKEIAPRYKERAGGYTRIIKLGPRRGDSAKMAIIELVK